MKRTLTILAGLTLAASVSSAQYSTPSTQNPGTPQGARTEEKAKGAEATFTGCLEKTKSGGFWLTKSMNTAGAAGATTTTAGAPGMTLNLEDGKNLDAHVGHKISVMGEMKEKTSGDEIKGSRSSDETTARDFKVTSFKMVSTSCS